MNKKTIVLVLALFSTLWLMGAGGTKFGYDALRKDLNLSDLRDASTSRTNLDVYSKTETDNLAAQSTLRYYFQEINSGLSTASKDLELFATSPVAVQASEAITLGTSNALLDQWITATNTPNLTTLVSGYYEIEGYLSKTGAGTAYVIPELWFFSTDGATGTFIASGATVTITGVVSATLYSSRISVPTAVSVGVTDRLVVKLYGYRSGVAGLTIWYGGVTDSFFGVPISPRNFLRTDGSNGTSGIITNIGGLSSTTIRAEIDADVATAQASVDAHIASNGAEVHGLGTMSTQSASAVSITSGTASLTSLIVRGQATVADSASVWFWRTHIVGKSGGSVIASDTVATDTTIAFGTADGGRITMIDRTGGSDLSIGTFVFMNKTVTEVTDPSNAFSITPGNSGTINVYIDSGTGYLQVENKETNNRSVKWVVEVMDD